MTESDSILLYDWHAHLVQADFHPGPVDLSNYIPPGPEDVEEGKTVVLFWVAEGPSGPRNGWWTTYEKFQEHAEPFSPAALKKEGEW